MTHKLSLHRKVANRLGLPRGTTSIHLRPRTTQRRSRQWSTLRLLPLPLRRLLPQRLDRPGQILLKSVASVGQVPRLRQRRLDSR